MDRLLSTQDRVAFILMRNPEARDSDIILYKEVCEEISKDFTKIPFGVALEMMNQYKIPPFETVRRARQKLQSKNPEIRGSKKVRNARKELENTFRDYARL